MKSTLYAIACLIAGVITMPHALAEDLFSAEQLKARQQHILGRPPRFEPLKPGEYDPAAEEAVAEIRRAIGAPPATEMPEYFATMMRHPALMRQQLEFSRQLFNGELSVRDRELAILRQAWLSRAPYEWGEHVLAGKREAGLTSEEIEWITQGSSAPGWSDHDRAILKAVEEMLADAMISDDTWDTLASTLNERQLLELPLLVGAYLGTAYLQNSARFRLMEHNEGLMAR